MAMWKGFTYIKIRLLSKGRALSFTNFFLLSFPFNVILFLPGVPYIYSSELSPELSRLKKSADFINKISFITFILSILLFIIAMYLERKK